MELYILVTHPPLPPPPIQLTAIATMAALFGWVWLGPWLTLGAAVGALHGHPGAALALAVILAAWAAPLKTDGSAAWPAFRDARIWDSWRRYFSLVIVTPGSEGRQGRGGGAPPPSAAASSASPSGHARPPTPSIDDLAPLAPGEPHLVVHFPHGTFPIGSFLSPRGAGVVGGLPPTTTVGAIASILFHLPLLRHVYAWCGCIPAGRASIEGALRAGKAVGLVPEGVAGIFSRATREREVVLSAHRGFVKLALRCCASAPAGDGHHHPTPIVPCFVFGQSRVLSFAGSARLSRTLRASVGVWWGRFGLPCLPRRVHLVVAAGRPVRLPRPAVPGAPTQAEIDAGWEAVLGELRRVYGAVRPGVRGYAGTRLEVK